MVEYKFKLNLVFSCLSDPTRRDILRKVSTENLSVTEIAAHYPLTFAAIAKHLDVLHRAALINKTRRGKEQIISISPHSLNIASNYLDNYKELWQNRLDSLDKFLKLNPKKLTKNKKG